MKKMKFTLTFFLFFLCFYSCSATINGPANIRISSNEKVILLLNDQEYVYAYELKNHWFEILINISFKSSDLVEGRYLIEGTKIYKKDNRTIVGEIKSKIDISEYLINNPSNEFSETIIYGFTFESNINSISILERKVENLINSNQLKSMDSLQTFNFNRYEVDEYVVWTFYDYSSPYASVDFRMIIYFDLKGVLIGVANRNRKLELKNKLESKIDRGYRMQYINLLPEKERILFEERMTNYFQNRD